MNPEIRLLADRIDNLIAQEHKLKRADWALREELLATQLKLAAMFGDRHGWRLSKKGFSPECLAVRGTHGHGHVEWPHEMLDHGEFFRKDRRAVAAVGHLYDLSPDAGAWARERCLKMSLPDFPSWYWPARTRLVVFEAVNSEVARLMLKPHRRHRWPQIVSDAVH